MYDSKKNPRAFGALGRPWILDPLLSTSSRRYKMIRIREEGRFASEHVQEIHSICGDIFPSKEIQLMFWSPISPEKLRMRIHGFHSNSNANSAGTCTNFWPPSGRIGSRELFPVARELLLGNTISITLIYMVLMHTDIFLSIILILLPYFSIDHIRFRAEMLQCQWKQG